MRLAAADEVKNGLYLTTHSFVSSPAFFPTEGGSESFILQLQTQIELASPPSETIRGYSHPLTAAENCGGATF